jgi:alkanesulfonate monooxygenase SsuD/methylene tetrahydromethanopterin reductase-like flavin-dependent oxidoreductase (luciferase family)
VKLSAFSVVDGSPAPAAGDPSARLAEVPLLAEAAEAGGLSALWVAEHHFHSGGVCPSPPVLLASLGARTHRLRLGALVSVLPFHRPIDLVEEYSMVDRLLAGRLNLGLGSGYIPTEFAGYGIDPATKRERFDAALEAILAGFAGEPIDAGGGPEGRVRSNVLPVQRPHPPLWVAVQRREAIPFVARRGLSIALIPYATLRDRSELADEIREYRAALPARSAGEVAVALHVYAGPHPELARAALARYLASRSQTHSTHYLAKSERDPSGSTPGGIESAGWALIGSPVDVAARMSEFEAIGVDELLGIFDFGGLPPDEVRRSVEGLGRAWAGRTRAATLPVRAGNPD